MIPNVQMIQITKDSDFSRHLGRFTQYRRNQNPARFINRIVLTWVSDGSGNASGATTPIVMSLSVTPCEWAPLTDTGSGGMGNAPPGEPAAGPAFPFRQL